MNFPVLLVPRPCAPTGEWVVFHPSMGLRVARDRTPEGRRLAILEGPPGLARLLRELARVAGAESRSALVVEVLRRALDRLELEE